jgi:hypothetical protein
MSCVDKALEDSCTDKVKKGTSGAFYKGITPLASPVDNFS